jgi:protoheme IX farnesyltransferase
MNENISVLTGKDLVQAKFKAYFELLKARLSFLVSFSSGFGYILGVQGNINWMTLMMLMLGGFLVSGASVTINQILEKKEDSVMNRTKNRPIPTGRITIREAWIYSFLLGLAGTILLWIYTNPQTLIISLLSMVLYSFVYTPLKKIGPIAVFVGAIPGAFPPFIGWLAATGEFGMAPGILFGIQFLWQFPHFWAIAWVSDDDYKRAGFKLLPGKGKTDFSSAVQIMTYTLFLLPMALLPVKIGITGMNSAIIATVCGVLFLAQTFNLMIKRDRSSALKIMFGSFLYLPIVQISFLLDIVV